MGVFPFKGIWLFFPFMGYGMPFHGDMECSPFMGYGMGFPYGIWGYGMLPYGIWMLPFRGYGMLLSGDMDAPVMGYGFPPLWDMFVDHPSRALPGKVSRRKRPKGGSCRPLTAPDAHGPSREGKTPAPARCFAPPKKRPFAAALKKMGARPLLPWNGGIARKRGCRQSAPLLPSGERDHRPLPLPSTAEWREAVALLLISSTAAGNLQTPVAAVHAGTERKPFPSPSYSRPHRRHRACTPGTGKPPRFSIGPLLRRERKRKGGWRKALPLLSR
nr:hypothetical protein Iba_chr02bCG14400 [Ipomoea batatas]